MMRVLRHADVLPGIAQVHLTRAELTRKRPGALHTQDFFVLFWVQNGQVRQHLPDGAQGLREGDAVFMRPGQPHGLQALSAAAFVVMLCFHPALIAAIQARHSQLAGHLFWADGPPAKLYRDIRQLAALNQAAVALEQGARDTLAAEAFLLPLCAELSAPTALADAPAWLQTACRAAHQPAVFRLGAAGLVAQTGKTHAHVSRMMQRHLGLTPSAYVNQIRLRAAAGLLVTDAQSIAEIAADCGLPNMAHFHKLFRAAYGLSPLQYRKKFQRQLVQPV